MKLKVLELFSGIGASSEALKRMGVPFEATYIENDEKVLKVFNQLTNNNVEPIDITTFKTKEKYDLVIAGFPCQPFSMAGNKKGFEDPRGKLYKDTLRIIKETEPKYIILENVKGILNLKHKGIVEEIVKELNEYNLKVEVKNSKDLGIRQERERLFIYGTKK